MPSRIAALVVLLLIAILPIRALASVVTGLCTAVDQQTEAQLHVHGDHGALPHHEDESTGNPRDDCGYCVKHCAGASLVISADPPRFSVSALLDEIAFGERYTAGLVLDPLDRPPLAF